MSSKVGIGFDEYLTYSHVTDYLKKTAEAYPDLTVLESAGKSYQGRDIWALTITNKKTGSASKKPALYVTEHPRGRSHRVHGGAVPHRLSCGQLRQG